MLLDVRRSLPFPLLGLDSDNGGEFINHHLVSWCAGQRITFRCSCTPVASRALKQAT